MKPYLTFWLKRGAITLLCIGCSGAILQAQMRVGQPAGSPDLSAALEVSGGPYSTGSQYRGIAPPKVALSQTASATPVSNPITGLLIYNTAKAGDVTPGYYYWEGSKWARFSTTSSTGSARSTTGTASIPGYLLADLPSLLSPYPDNFILVDPGREGLFSLTTDTSIPDNRGTVLVTGTKYYKRVVDNAVNVKWFGAKGDGATDDTQAIQKAVNAGYGSILFPATTAYYKVTDFSVFSNLNKRKLIATGATILNSDLTKQTWLFEDCMDIEIEGGEWGYATMPMANGGGAQHVFQFQRCQRVLVNNIHIRNSPEIGIAITNSNRVTVQNSLIEHTWRDGIYTRYSANVIYSNNRLNNIKDDAISFHDKDVASGGVDAEKSTLNGYGYSQASNCQITGNTIENTYQGIVSIGGSGVSVTDNTIINTVNAGIALYNILNTDPAGVRNSNVSNNRLTNTCSIDSITINNKRYSDNGQSGPGRAAIFIGSTGGGNQVNNGESKHLTNIQVFNNTVLSSGSNAFWANLVDGLSLTDNTFLNCSGINGAHQLGGIPVEIGGTTGLYASNNTVNDTRSTVMHEYGYQIGSVTGYSDNWNVPNYKLGEGQILGSTISTEASKKNIAVKLPNFNSSSTGADFNSLTTAGIVQITGGAWGAAHAPTIAATAGNLEIARSNDAITQRYTDYLGNVTVRAIYGISSGNWSPWSPLPITTAAFKQGTSAVQNSPGATVFAFPHGAGFTPTSGHVMAATAGADQTLIQYILFDATSVIVFYKQTINSGTPLQWYYEVYK